MHAVIKTKASTYEMHLLKIHCQPGNLLFNTSAEVELRETGVCQSTDTEHLLLLTKVINYYFD